MTVGLEGGVLLLRGMGGPYICPDHGDHGAPSVKLIHTGAHPNTFSPTLMGIFHDDNIFFKS